MEEPDSSSGADAMNAPSGDFEDVVPTKEQTSGSDTSDTEDDDTVNAIPPTAPIIAAVIGDEEEVIETPIIKNNKKSVSFAPPEDLDAPYEDLCADDDFGDDSVSFATPEDIDDDFGDDICPSITSIAARVFVANQNAKVAANPNADNESEPWMSKPVGGEDGEPLPAAILPPPKPCPREKQDSKQEATPIENQILQADQQDSGEEAAPTESYLRQAMRSSLSQYREHLFGDKRPSNPSTDSDGTAPSIKPRRRVQLPNEVLYNASTNLWVTTFHTDQKSLDRGDHDLATQSMRAFSFKTEDQAREAVLAKAPPRMQPFSDNPRCSDCMGKFAVFRRACHCRNCGVCVCKIDCCVLWPAKSMPKPYNIKGELAMNVCKACHSLSSKFRDALLSGNLEEVIRLHETGNVNLRSPFAHVKGEVMYPIHCAVLSGNLDLLRWLLEDRHCPFKAPKKKKSIRPVTDGTIVTSKGRSLLELAVAANQVDILRYLVVEKNITVLKYRDLSTALVALDSALRRVPKATLDDDTIDMVQYKGGRRQYEDGAEDGENAAPADDISEVSIENELKTDQAEETSEGKMEEGTFDKVEIAGSSSAEEDCIVCFANKIDCVNVPCGHQICCLNCSSNMSECPVCNTSTTFIRTFRP